MPGISQERLSSLIGQIYDCAIDPHQWPNTMKEICIWLDYWERNADLGAKRVAANFFVQLEYGQEVA